MTAPFWISIGKTRDDLINDDECYSSLDDAKKIARQHPAFEIYDDTGELIAFKPAQVKEEK